MERFENVVAMVGGGARGMGASRVRGLVDEGARVVSGDILAAMELGGAILGPVFDMPEQ